MSGLVGTASCQLEKTTPDHVVVTALRMPFTRDVVIVSDDSPLLERAIGGSSPLVGDHMCVVATVVVEVVAGLLDPLQLELDTVMEAGVGEERLAFDVAAVHAVRAENRPHGAEP